MDREFSLIPFAAAVAGIERIDGSIALQDGCLVLTCRITGAVGSVFLPRPEASPARRDNLWKTSCCECFVQADGRADYHEINLSPNGDWNVYRFTGYRTGMAEEAAIARIDSALSLESDSAVLRCRVPLHGCYTPPLAMRAGVCCILLHRSGALSYWALAHPRSTPDFHDPRGFRLALGWNLDDSGSGSPAGPLF